MTGAIGKLVSRIEIAIRYLLTGSVVSLLVVFARTDYESVLKSAAEKETISAGIAIFAGFIAFTLYRLVLWTLGDFIAWKIGWSAPSVFPHKGLGYDKPYVSFLKWRQSDAVNDRLGGYLTYRWAVAHFASVAGIAAILGAYLSQSGSFLQAHMSLTYSLGLAALGFGMWQTSFLYRVERNLCQQAK